MLNKHSPVKSLTTRIPVIIFVKGRESVNHGSGFIIVPRLVEYIYICIVITIVELVV